MTKTYETKLNKENAILVGVDILDSTRILPMEESLIELEMLAETAGIAVEAIITQKIQKPNPKTFVGSGKVSEINSLLNETKSDIVIFDSELNPRHQRELEKILGEGIRVLDRTALILDIFALHAKTHEGALQVELAQLEYRLPRLTRAWTHLARQAGGGGGGSGAGVGLRGPGEKQLESDKREINRRLIFIKEQLEKVRAHRTRHRNRRKKSNIPVVALVGYTNAGKSTLLNQLADAKVFVADKLFATLDPTTRRIYLPGGKECLITDTVGFIQNLPTTLIAAFRATLEEINEADLLIHVVDVSHPNSEEHIEAVNQTLESIEAEHIPSLLVYNKIDQFSTKEIQEFIDTYNNEDTLVVSAKKGIFIKELLTQLENKLYEQYVAVHAKIPYDKGNLISQVYDLGKADKVEHQRDGIEIEARLPYRIVAQYNSYLIEEEENNEETVI